MKRYIVSFAASTEHVPAHPERTAKRALSWDVEFQVWPSREAMLTTVRMQGKRASRSNDWKPCIGLEVFFAVRGVEEAARALAPSRGES